MSAASRSISLVLTVYNKSDVLDATLDSFVQDDPEHIREYIFVDDASTDNSIALIQERTKDWPKIKIIHNTENEGPARRLNQGASKARGTYLFLMDMGDILLPDALEKMVLSLQKENGDLFYGGWNRSLKALPKVIHSLSPFVSETPYQDVLAHGCTKMSVLCTRALFEKAGGADPRLFVQDQSLALRLGFYAKKLLISKTIVIYAPPSKHMLSRNLAQQHHDGFHAFKNALEDFRSEERVLYAKMVSVVWKKKRGTPFGWPFFLFYALVKWCHPKPFAIPWLAHCVATDTSSKSL